MAHDMLQDEDTTLPPCPHDVLSLPWVNHREQIRACENLVNLNVVRIVEVACIQVLIVCRADEPLCQFLPLNQVALQLLLALVTIFSEVSFSEPFRLKKIDTFKFDEEFFAFIKCVVVPILAREFVLLFFFHLLIFFFGFMFDVIFESFDLLSAFVFIPVLDFGLRLLSAAISTLSFSFLSRSRRRQCIFIKRVKLFPYRTRLSTQRSLPHPISNDRFNLEIKRMNLTRHQVFASRTCLLHLHTGYLVFLFLGYFSVALRLITLLLQHFI